jgi:hypothetical protein
VSSQSSHLNIAQAPATSVSCIPYLDGMLLMVTAGGVGATLQIDGRQFEAIRACLDAFAATGAAQHHYALSEGAAHSVAASLGIAAGMAVAA